MATQVAVVRAAWASRRPSPRPAHPPGPSWQYLLAAAVGLADVAEELESLLRGRTGVSGGGRERVARTGSRCEGYSAKGPAVTALQDGDLQGAPGTRHLYRE